MLLYHLYFVIYLLFHLTCFLSNHSSIVSQVFVLELMHHFIINVFSIIVPCTISNSFIFHVLCVIFLNICYIYLCFYIYMMFMLYFSIFHFSFICNMLLLCLLIQVYHIMSYTLFSMLHVFTFINVFVLYISHYLSSQSILLTNW